MSIADSIHQRMRDARAGAEDRGRLDAHVPGDRIGGEEADALDVPGESIRVLLHQVDGVLAVGLEDPHGAGGGDAIGVQKHHDVADDPLIGPALDDPLGAHFANALDLAQLGRCGFDDGKHFGAEGFDETLGVGGTDAPDETRGEVALDADFGGRRQDPQLARLELPAVLAVDDPLADGGGVLTDGHGRRVPDQRFELLVPAHFDAQNTEAVLGVMVGDAFHEAGEGLGARRSRAAVSHSGTHHAFALRLDLTENVGMASNCAFSLQ